MTFRWHHDGGCYFLSKDDFNHLVHYTVVRRQVVEELHTLLVSAEAQLHHIIRLVADSLPPSGRTQNTHRLQELVQQFTGIKRQYYTMMHGDDQCQELQSIYQRRLSLRYWKPHPVPTRIRSCPSFQNQRYTARFVLPYDYLQLRRGFSPTFEPTSD